MDLVCQEWVMYSRALHALAWHAIEIPGPEKDVLVILCAIPPTYDEAFAHTPHQHMHTIHTP